jgi:hypothetical protein
MTPLLGRVSKTGVLVLAAAVLAACSASSPGQSPAGPAGGRGTGGGWVGAAAGYIAQHPAAPRAGMNSGILLSAEWGGPDAPSVCQSGRKCWWWSGTVVEAGRRVVHIGSPAGVLTCTGQPAWPPSGQGDLADLDAYVYFPASGHLCPPAGLIVIKAHAITAPDATAGWEPES